MLLNVMCDDEGDDEGKIIRATLSDERARRGGASRREDYE
jgi:hypothetical protein